MSKKFMLLVVMLLICLVAFSCTGCKKDYIKVNPGPNQAYLVHYSENAISLLDLKTKTILGKMTVGIQPYDVKISPDGKYIYVVNFASNDLSVINAANHQLVKNISLDTGPVNVITNSDNSRIYVTNYNNNSISVINEDLKLLQHITVETNPAQMAISKDNKYLYVTAYGSDDVAVIDTASNTVLKRLYSGTQPVDKKNPTGKNPVGIALDEKNGFLYTCNYYSNDISVINLKDRAFEKTKEAKGVEVPSIKVAKGPQRLLFHQQSNALYVTCNKADKVVIIDPIGKKVLKELSVMHPVNITMNKDGSRIYITSPVSKTIFVIDPVKQELVEAEKITIEKEPVSIVIR